MPYYAWKMQLLVRNTRSSFAMVTIRIAIYVLKRFVMRILSLVINVMQLHVMSIRKNAIGVGGIRVQTAIRQ